MTSLQWELSPDRWFVIGLGGVIAVVSFVAVVALARREPDYWQHFTKGLATLTAAALALPAVNFLWGKNAPYGPPSLIGAYLPLHWYAGSSYVWALYGLWIGVALGGLFVLLTRRA